ncbi:MAG: hypothetical protein ACKO0Z_03415, partial [Betaproteobacteria bacterium]
MSENDKGQEGDDDTLPTEFVSTDDNDAKTAHSEFQEQFALQPAQRDALAQVGLALADLHDGMVALSSSNLVLIDLDAAGHGWF